MGLNPLIQVDSTDAGKSKGIDLAACNFVDINDSHPDHRSASIGVVVKQMQDPMAGKIQKCTPDPTGEFQESEVADKTTDQRYQKRVPYCGPKTICLTCCFGPYAVCYFVCCRGKPCDEKVVEVDENGREIMSRL